VRTLKAVVASATALGSLLFASRNAAAAPMSTSPEQAYDLGEIPSARAVGMGGALNALGVSTSSLYLNPANMPLARVYHFETLAAYVPEASRQTYGLAVADSMTGKLAGGAAATWSLLDPSGIHRTWTDIRAAFGFPLGDHLALGAAARWLRVEQDASAGPFGASPASSGTANAPIFNAITFDAGATVSIGDGFRMAAVGHNLTFTNTALAPTTAAAGVGYSAQVFAIEADGLLDFTTWGNTRGRIMGGGELFLADHYAIRAGWRYDGGTKLNTPSLGFGYIDPHWSVEVGVRRDIEAAHGSTLAVLSLRYFYDPNASTSPADQLGGF
jgi:hypothetical protein